MVGPRSHERTGMVKVSKRKKVDGPLQGLKVMDLRIYGRRSLHDVAGGYGSGVIKVKKIRAARTPDA